MNKIKLFAVAAVCALTMASCGEKDQSSQAADSQTDSTAASSEVSDTGSAADDTPSSKADDVSEGDTSSKADDSVIYDPELIKLAREMYDAKKIEGDELEDLFEAEYDNEGAAALCADIKTVKIFDPFDDMLTQIIALSDVKPHAQIMMLSQFVEIEDGMMADGLLMAIGFGCKDEEEAKEVFTHVFTEDMKEDLDYEDEEDPDYLKSQVSEDGDTILMSFGDDEFMAYFAYYRVGKNIYVLGIYDTEFTDTPVNGEYKQVYDYKKEADSICEKLGVESPTILRK